MEPEGLRRRPARSSPAVRRAPRTLVRAAGQPRPPLRQRLRPHRGHRLRHRQTPTWTPAVSPSAGPSTTSASTCWTRTCSRCPSACPGELYIGGAGLARGYLGRPELTAERFVPDPFAAEPGARLYRTGDLARWLRRRRARVPGPHRLPGEDARLPHRAGRDRSPRSPPIPRCARPWCWLREDAPGDKRLVAYVVLPPRAQVRPSSDRGAAHLLQQRLPEYMVPSAFVAAGGAAADTQRQGGPQGPARAGGSARSQSRTYVAPRNARGAALAGIWAAGAAACERVGVHDNFFELGGDSILSLQVVARARQAGLRLPRADLFQHQTVADAGPSSARSTSEPLAEQGPVAGAVPLTPIQRWSCSSRTPPTPHHFNQSCCSTRASRWSPTRWRRRSRHLLAHHDALRLRFARSDDGAWRRRTLAPSEAPVACSRWTSPRCPPRAASGRWRPRPRASRPASTWPQPPAAARRALPPRRRPAQRLLLVVHHLVVDGVSWRILLEDLEPPTSSSSAARAPSLPAKTTSFQAWARRLEAHAHSEALAREAPFWLDEARQRGRPRCPWTLPGADTLASARTVVRGARRRGDAAAAAGGARGLARAHQRRAAHRAGPGRLRDGRASRVLVDLEGHGREELFADVDLSRTVGWFTSLTPVLLPVPAGGRRATRCASVRDSLRRLPHRGIGFGLLRYLRTRGRSRQRLRGAARGAGGLQLPRPVRRHGRRQRASSPWRTSPLGPSVAPEPAHALHVLEVERLGARGPAAAVLRLQRPPAPARPPSRRWPQRFLRALRALIAQRALRGRPALHARATSRWRACPSRAGRAARGRPAPTSRTSTRCRPLQQGMLFHALLCSRVRPPTSSRSPGRSTSRARPASLPARVADVPSSATPSCAPSFLWEGLDDAAPGGARARGAAVRACSTGAACPPPEQQSRFDAAPARGPARAASTCAARRSCA